MIRDSLTARDDRVALAKNTYLVPHVLRNTEYTLVWVRCIDKVNYMHLTLHPLLSQTIRLPLT
jgi:hypothetical protein